LDLEDDAISEAIEAHGSDDDEDDESGATFTLPKSVRKSIRTKYSELCNGEEGAASYYCKMAAKSVRCMMAGKKERVIWQFEESDAMWKRVDFDTWRGLVSLNLQAQLPELWKLARTELNLHMSIDKKSPMAQKWKQVNQVLQKTSDRLTGLQANTNIAKIAFTRLEDKDFMMKLNARRDVISFRNGLLSLRTLELVPRTEDHYISYALDYDYDPTLPTTNIQQFIAAWYPGDALAQEAMQVLAGYWLTGEVCVKGFWQLTSPPHSGKTSFINAVRRAAGAYFSRDIPITETSASQKFEDTICRVLCPTDGRPWPRACFMDEGKADLTLNEALINQLTDGKSDQAAQLRIKFEGARPSPYNYHAKWIFSSNHTINFDVGAEGTSERTRGIGLRYTYPPEYRAAPFTLPRNAALVEYLESNAARQEIMLWMVRGAVLYYELGGLLSCPVFERSTLELRINGNPFYRWFVTKYTPTGNIDTSEDNRESRIILDVLVKEFIADNREPARNKHAYKGLQYLLDSFRDFVISHSWDQWGTLEHGYIGLTPRRSGDPSWPDAREKAQEKVAAWRAAHPAL
jgi:phage/plasmid-associated DNA primase